MTIEEARIVLGLDADASDEDVRRAYRLRARMMHPDRFADRPASELRLATAEFQRITAARDALLRAERAPAGPDHRTPAPEEPKPRPEAPAPAREPATWPLAVALVACVFGLAAIVMPNEAGAIGIGVVAALIGLLPALAGPRVSGPVYHPSLVAACAVAGIALGVIGVVAGVIRLPF